MIALHSILVSIVLNIIGFINLSIPLTGVVDPILSDYYSGLEAMKDQGNYNEALTCFLNFLRASEDCPDRYADQIMRTYCYVGIIYGSYEDYSLSLNYHLKGLKLADERRDSRFRNAFLNNIAWGYISKKQYGEARKYVSSILDGDSVDNRRLFCYNILMGEISIADSNYTDATNHYRVCENIVANDSEFTDYERANVLQAMAKIYALTDRTDSQLCYLQKGLAVSLNQSRPEIKLESVRELMRYHTMHGNSDSALHYQDTYFAFADSLMSRVDFMQIRGDHELMGLASREQRISSLRNRVKIQWVIIAVVTIILGIVITLLIIIFRQKRNLDTAYHVLFEQDRQLDTLLTRNLIIDSHTVNPDAPNVENKTEISEPSLEERGLFDKICVEMQSSQGYLDPDFSLATLAALVRSNTVTVSKVISICTGQNVRTFINEFRIREAKRRITDLDSYGQMTLQAIGESVGYSTQVNFNRAFKKMTGMTPSAYLALAKENAAKSG